jgi:DNA polymerase III alpha subunit
MASVLTHSASQHRQDHFLHGRMSSAWVFKVLGPDVNESSFQFSVNKAGQIRFGLGAVKGVGENAVDAIVEERSRKRTDTLRIYDFDASREPAQRQPKGVGESSLRWCIR